MRNPVQASLPHECTILYTVCGAPQWQHSHRWREKKSESIPEKGPVRKVEGSLENSDFQMSKGTVWLTDQWTKSDYNYIHLAYVSQTWISIAGIVILLLRIELDIRLGVK